MRNKTIYFFKILVYTIIILFWQVIILKERYLTVKNTGEGELIIKRSRFIASVSPVKTEEEAIAFINRIKQKYPDARHNVYAYIIEENNIMRYSDDGEPAGTGGVPVLDFLRKEQLTDLAVVVTRYFGGILLGTGGLVHAYSQTAKEGVQNANITEMVLCREVIIECDYNLWGKLQNELSAFVTATLPPEYTDIVKLRLYVPVSHCDLLTKTITEATNAKISISLGEQCYFGFDT